MSISRRQFMALSGMAAGSLLTPPAADARQSNVPGDASGALVDLTMCVGCRKCEQACNTVNELPAPQAPFDDPRVLNEYRRPTDRAFTVVNRFHTGRLDERDRLIHTYVKTQCMHCQDPACVSACIVGALTKKPNGAVHYDASKCIGCRYCLIACPFQIPSYEYHDPLTPRVRKCTFCFDRISQEGGKPGCASVCPVEAITFGKRAELLKLARHKLETDPGRYIQHIYGENEVGGTSWMYISGEPFDQLGFQTLPSRPIPHLTETIQHSVFAYMWAPLALYAGLGGAMWISNRKKGHNPERTDPHGQEDRR